MKKTTNLLAVAVLAAATFAASQSANATMAAGQMAMTAPVANAVMDTASTTTGGMVQLAHGKRWRHWHGHYGHGFYGYGPYYGGGCHWLKRKWHRTGKYYWKKRYFRCINGWY